MLSAAAAARSAIARRSASRVTTQTKKTATSPYQRRSMGSDMPVPQSQNAPLWHGHTVQKEGWEEYMYFYYIAGVVLQAAVLMAAPETSIESWARNEAKARLYLEKTKGQTEFEFGTHYQDVVEEEKLNLWSQFAAKSVTPGDDDDDDDDDEDEDEDEEDDDE
mmetsp:Transcript_23727/g.38667  ORF Transcript_23727/g.38667 Transcript_23727/m.38667 type:complete len:163 (+) Transcript_23727:114-602(+)